MASTTRSSQAKHPAPQSAPTAPAVRWECGCQTPPVLLATWEVGGRVNVKVRDRYWHFDGFGQVHAVCPRCASEHVLDLSAAEIASTPASTN